MLVIKNQLNIKYQHLELTKKISRLNIINREETEKCDAFTKHKAEEDKVKRFSESKRGSHSCYNEITGNYQENQ